MSTSREYSCSNLIRTCTVLFFREREKGKKKYSILVDGHKTNLQYWFSNKSKSSTHWTCSHFVFIKVKEHPSHIIHPKESEFWGLLRFFCFSGFA